MIWADAQNLSMMHVDMLRVIVYTLYHFIFIIIILCTVLTLGHFNDYL